MIALSHALKTILSRPTVETAILVKISNALLFTSSYLSITTAGDTYTPSEDTVRLISVDPPKITSSVDRASYSITFADPDMYFGQWLESLVPPGSVGTHERGYTGLPVMVRLAVFDAASYLTDSLLLYKGVVDTGAYSIDLEEFGESVFTLTCSSPMSSLDMIRTFYTTKNDLRGIYATDAAFDQIYEGSGQIRLLWGKG
jgi:hypothetical protein